ncbi:HIRA-interacting protein 3-like [Branchiostoma lanceolatum]|uniref:HIRA-interacting protein 3-like n=1 Tax=Branchiostoma lanceolatum TaxID=7740 RepID=UPI0034566FA2
MEYLMETLRTQIDEWKELRDSQTEQGHDDDDFIYDDDFEEVSDSDDDGFDEQSYFTDIESDDSRGSEDGKKVSLDENGSESEGEIEECFDENVANKPVQTKEGVSESEEEIDECIGSDTKRKSLQQKSSSATLFGKDADSESEEEIEESIGGDMKSKPVRQASSSIREVDSDSEEEIEECIGGSFKTKQGNWSSPKPTSNIGRMSASSQRRDSNRGQDSARVTRQVRSSGISSYQDGARGREQRTVILGDPYGIKNNNRDKGRDQTSKEQTGGISMAAPSQKRGRARADRVQEAAVDQSTCHEGHVIRKLKDKVDKLELLIEKAWHRDQHTLTGNFQPPCREPRQKSNWMNCLFA